MFKHMDKKINNIVMFKTFTLSFLWKKREKVLLFFKWNVAITGTWLSFGLQYGMKYVGVKWKEKCSLSLYIQINSEFGEALWLTGLTLCLPWATFVVC